MGKVTSTIYTCSYLIAGCAILAIGAQLAALAWGLLALAALATAVLAVAGDRIDALAGQNFGAEATDASRGLPGRRHSPRSVA